MLRFGLISLGQAKACPTKQPDFHCGACFSLPCSTKNAWPDRTPEPERRPPRWGSQCPRNGRRTKPPGWPGPIIRRIGRTSSDVIRWVYTEMVRRISPGERIRMLVNSRSEEKLARRYLGRAGVMRGAWSSSCIRPTAGGLATAARCSCAETWPAGSKPPSCISISMRGPSIPTGARTAACGDRRRAARGNGCSTRNGRDTRWCSKAAAST